MTDKAVRGGSRLLVFQADVQNQNICILDPLRHVRMSCPMIEYQSFDQLGIKVVTVLHLHNLHHLEIDR